MNSHGYRASDLVKLEVLVNKQPVDALAMIVHEDDAYHRGQRLVTELEEADSPPDVRSADSGRHQQTGHQPGQC
jgi:translation elongation factor EF-4